jgi:hypothetical protein
MSPILAGRFGDWPMDGAILPEINPSQQSTTQCDSVQHERHEASSAQPGHHQVDGDEGGYE